MSIRKQQELDYGYVANESSMVSSIFSPNDASLFLDLIQKLIGGFS